MRWGGGGGAMAPCPTLPTFSSSGQFTDFKRTHADMWETQRQLFEREQLDAFNDIMVSPDYFC